MTRGVATAGAILMVAPDYPPTNRVASLRAYYLAQALARRGHDVTVLAETAPRGGAGLDRPDGAVQVRRIAATNRVAWLLRTFREVVRARSHARPVAIVTTSGPFVAHMAGAFAKRCVRSAAWVADYRDVWSSSHYYGDAPGWPAVRRFRRWFERRVLRHADMVTTVSAGLQQELSRFLGRSVLVFHNGYEPDTHARTTFDAPGAPARPVPPLQVCHTGSLYAERSPAAFLAVLDALRGARPEHGRELRAVFAGDVDPVVAKEFQRHSTPGVAYLGRLDRAAAYRLQQESDYCLLLEDAGASRNGVLTGKVFEYMGLRKPVIAFGIDPASELARLLQPSGLLAFCGSDGAALQAFLVSALDRPSRPAAPDDAYIRRFDRSIVSDAFAAQIARCIDARGSNR